MYVKKQKQNVLLTVPIKMDLKKKKFFTRSRHAPFTRVLRCHVASAVLGLKRYSNYTKGANSVRPTRVILADSYMEIRNAPSMA